VAFSQCPPVSGADELNAKAIGELVGVEATASPDHVVRVSWPRKDVKVEVDGLPLRPFGGLASWAAFQATQHGAMMMGDTALFEDEVNPAIDAAFAAGLEVTALHNHFFYDEPKVYFMHIGGNGQADKLASGVKRVWDAVKNVRKENAQPAKRFSGGVPAHGELATAGLEKTIAAKGQLNDGVFKITIGRASKMHGVEFAGSMGLTTWAAFAGSDELAAVDGDFAMTAEEVQPVLRALRKADINIVALHNHMIGETPQIFFTHFWGKGKAADLAKGLKQALNAQRQAHQEKPGH
jgi:hypothetical protein